MVREFVKIIDDLGETIIVRKLPRKLEWGYQKYYFVPYFRLNDTCDRITRKDCLIEIEDVTGYRSKGFQLSNKKEWDEFCRKQFDEFRDTLFINDWQQKEPIYKDIEKTSVRFHF